MTAEVRGLLPESAIAGSAPCSFSSVASGDPSGKSSFITDVATRLLRLEDPVERDNYVGLLSYKYDVSAEAVNEVIKKQALAGTGITIKPKPISTRSGKNDILDATTFPQTRLLSWLCDEPAIYKVIKKYITADDFADPLYREIATILFEQLENGQCNPADIISMFPEEEQQRRIAEAFHQSLGDLEGLAMKEMALRDLMINIKQHPYIRMSGFTYDLRPLTG